MNTLELYELGEEGRCSKQFVGPCCVSTSTWPCTKLPPPQAESTSPTEGILTEQNEVANQVAHERSTSPMEDIQTDRDDARKRKGKARRARRREKRPKTLPPSGSAGPNEVSVSAPNKTPCGVCAKTVTRRGYSVQCRRCGFWHHRACLNWTV